MGHLLKLFRPILGQGATKHDPKTEIETKMGPKSTKMEPIWAGGGKGQPKINENMKKYKKRKRKEAKQEKNVVFEIWCDFLKNRRAQRLGVYRGVSSKCNKNAI